MIRPNYTAKAIRQSIGPNGTGSFCFSYAGYTFTNSGKGSQANKIVTYLAKKGQATRRTMAYAHILPLHKYGDLFSGLREAHVLNYNASTKMWSLGENADLLM